MKCTVFILTCLGGSRSSLGCHQTENYTTWQQLTKGGQRAKKQGDKQNNWEYNFFKQFVFEQKKGGFFLNRRE